MSHSRARPPSSPAATAGSAAPSRWSSRARAPRSRSTTTRTPTLRTRRSRRSKPPAATRRSSRRTSRASPTSRSSSTARYRRSGASTSSSTTPGMETRTSTLDTTEHQFDMVIAIDLKSAFFGVQLAAKQMIAQGGGGRIINISSIHEDWPMPGNSPYCLAKGGVRMLTRTAGVELAPHGITVVGVAPGAVHTPIDEVTLSDPAAKARLESAIPLGRVAEPQEIANLVAFLASDGASYGTAATYTVDGGHDAGERRSVDEGRRRDRDSREPVPVVVTVVDRATVSTAPDSAPKPGDGRQRSRSDRSDRDPGRRRLQRLREARDRHRPAAVRRRGRSGTEPSAVSIPPPTGQPPTGTSTCRDSVRASSMRSLRTGPGSPAGARASTRRRSCSTRMAARWRRRRATDGWRRVSRAIRRRR